MQELLLALTSYIPSFSLENLDPSAVQAIYVFAIVFFVFIFLVLIGFTRHHIIETSLHGFWAGLWTGVIVIGILGGTLIWGARNFIFGEKFALLPPGFQNVLSASGEGLTGVLGISTEREQPTAGSVLSSYKLLNSVDAELVSNSICKPNND